MAKLFTLGKNERLKSRKQIERLFAEGKSFVVNPFRIYFDHRLLTMDHGLQFGVGVSNRNFKKAVDRNRIKRLTREAWRLQKNELQEKINAGKISVNVFFIYIGKELPDFILVKNKVAVALKKIAGNIDENNSSNS